MASVLCPHSAGCVAGSSIRQAPVRTGLCSRLPAQRANPGRSRVATFAYAPALGAQLGSDARVSLDPMAKEWAQDYTPGRLVTIKSPEQMESLVEQHHDKLIVLMCKSHSCRPCKMFTRKYMAMAERFPEVVMCEIYGDETPETRKMMMKLQVKVTPTFRMYREKECVNIVTGTNEKKLMRGILSQLFPAELVSHEKEIADTLLDEQEEAAAAPAVAHS